MDFKRLNGWEKEMLLEACFYLMGQKMRHQIMGLLPALYNKAAGREIITVNWDSKGGVGE